MSNCLVSFCDEKFIVAGVVCGQGIKPGGQEDLGFVSEIVLPYYLSKNWLGIDLPKGQKYLDDRTITPFSFYLSRPGKQDSRQVLQY